MNNNDCNLCNFTGDRNLDLYYKVLYTSNNGKYRILLHYDTIATSFIALETEVYNDNGIWCTLERKYLNYCPNCGRKLNDISVSSN